MKIWSFFVYIYNSPYHGKAGKGVLILVDEVQSDSEELKKLIIAYQEMVGEGQDIALVFAGLPVAISRTLNQHVLTFFNRASKLYLEPISIPEVSIYYRKCFDASGILISDEWVDQAAKKTEGSPYLMQLIGHYIVLSAEDGETYQRTIMNEHYIWQEKSLSGIFVRLPCPPYRMKTFVFFERCLQMRRGDI